MAGIQGRTWECSSFPALGVLTPAVESLEKLYTTRIFLAHTYFTSFFVLCYVSQ